MGDVAATVPTPVPTHDAVEHPNLGESTPSPFSPYFDQEGPAALLQPGASLIPFSSRLTTPAIKEPSPSPVVLFPSQETSGDGMAHSLAYLDAASHDVRARRLAEERSNKGTGPAYARHICNYCEWWDMYQGQCHEQDPLWVLVPALPITPAKAALFLDHELTREKVSPSPSCLSRLMTLLSI